MSTRSSRLRVFHDSRRRGPSVRVPRRLCVSRLCSEAKALYLFLLLVEHGESVDLAEASVHVRHVRSALADLEERGWVAWAVTAAGERCVVVTRPRGGGGWLRRAFRRLDRALSLPPLVEGRSSDHGEGS